MSERLSPEQPWINEAQEATLRDLCERYHVEYNPDHYYVYPSDSVLMRGWVEGWIGGYDIQQEHPTIYCGVSPEGQAHS